MVLRTGAGHSLSLVAIMSNPAYRFRPQKVAAPNERRYVHGLAIPGDWNPKTGRFESDEVAVVLVRTLRTLHGFGPGTAHDYMGN